MSDDTCTECGRTTDAYLCDACGAALEKECVNRTHAHDLLDLKHLRAEVACLRADLEIAESRKSIVIRRLAAFARECRDNWDCDTDAHRRGTLCRACEAKRALTPCVDLGGER